MRALSLLLVAIIASTAFAEHQQPPKSITNSVGMTLVKIEPGEFQMGTGDGPPTSEAQWKERHWDESPAHRVTIRNEFHIGTCEVTNAQYELFDPEHRTKRGLFRVSEADDEPVTFVTWQQAVDYCAWLSKKEGKPYRLPTEAEWEYACRAGTTTRFHTGDSLTSEQANIAGTKRDRTKAVASYRPNHWGLHDMHGNVEEWCHDWYAPYTAGEQVDPIGPADGYAKVTRGGSYDIPGWSASNAHFARSANRSGHLPDDANRCTGFRVVLGKLPDTKPTPSQPPALVSRNVSQTDAPTADPTQGKPYFDDFRDRQATIAEDTWGPIFSRWNHYTACCVCPNGDVLACWYTTKSESGRELAQAASRRPAGSDTWQPASLFFDVPDVNDHAPVLLTHEGRIFHFASQSLAGWDETTNIVRTSDDNGATWSRPRIIARREGPHNLSQACSGFVSKEGTIYLAVDGNSHRTESLLIGHDLGKTWTLAEGDMRKAVGGEYAIHPAMVPGESDSLVAFLRGPNPMPRLVSHDHGNTWDFHKTTLSGIAVGQKAAALRLASGALLLCLQDTRKPPLTGQRGTMAVLSFDDGATWKHVRHLPRVIGYLSAAQAPNGIIYVFGSRQSCVAFNQPWLEEGDAVP